MKDKKERTDLSHKLSEMCLKIALANLAFAFAGFALGERLREIPQFDAFGKFELARDILGAQLGDLEEDPCWRLYVATLPDETAVSRTTLQELTQVECSDQVPKVVKIGAKRMVAGASNGATTNAIGAATVASGAEHWLPMTEVGAIDKTVMVLWDEPTLNSALRYSRVAGEEIYRWRLHRARIFKQRVAAAELKSGHLPADGTFDVSRLQIGDLREIAKSSHTGVVEIDRLAREQFSAPLPDTSYGVKIGTAFQMDAGIIVLLAATLTAYIRAALNADAKSTPGTVFHVLLGSSWGELVVCTALGVPLAAEAYLYFSVGMKGSAGVYLLSCTVVNAVAVLMALRRLFR